MQSYQALKHEYTLLWNDAQLAIDWPITAEPIFSQKDRDGIPFEKAETFP